MYTCHTYLLEKLVCVSVIKVNVARSQMISELQLLHCPVISSAEVEHPGAASWNLVALWETGMLQVDMLLA